MRPVRLQVDTSWRYRIAVPLITGFLVLFALMLIVGGIHEPIFSQFWIYGLGTGAGLLMTAGFISYLSRGIYRWIEVAEGEIRFKSLWTGRLLKYPLIALKRIESTFVYENGRSHLVFADGSVVKLSSGDYQRLEEFTILLTEIHTATVGGLESVDLHRSPDEKKANGEPPPKTD